jgi:hypothetical protein
VEIVKCKNELIFHELAPNDLNIRMIDMGIPGHDSMVNIWKLTNIKIEDRLEELRSKKEVLKASNRKLMD